MGCPMSHVLSGLMLSILLLFSAEVAAEEQALKRPILPEKIAPESLAAEEAIANAVLSIPDSTLIQWNPPYADFFLVGCPNCTLDKAHEATNFEWSPESPENIRCRHCSELYPSPRYPLTEVTRIRTPAGTMREYPYYSGDDGRRYYLESCVYNLRRRWLHDQALRLAKLYTTTGRSEYARKAGVIIRRAAEVYPEIPFHAYTEGGKFNPTLYEIEEQPAPPDGVEPVPNAIGLAAYRNYEPKYPYNLMRSGLGYKWEYDEFPTELARAYDQIAETMSGPDQRLIENYFRSVLNYVRSYPRYLFNTAPRIIEDEILCGRIIGEPEFVHGGIIHLKLLFEQNFFADGVWYEASPDYDFQVYEELLHPMKILAGYSDPPGYVGKEKPMHYQNLSPEAEFPEIARLSSSLKNYSMPDGNLVCSADTWSSTSETIIKAPGYYQFEPLPQSRSALQWASGHGMLGAGADADQIQARLNYTGFLGHYHYDRLGLILFARGRELYSDIGYTCTTLRPWAASTLAHNLVMVNESSQSFFQDDPIGGEVAAFVDQYPEVQFFFVKSPMVYPETKTYQRALALVRVSDHDHYLVDLFQVDGGQQHDWLLHGNADTNSYLESDLPFQAKGERLPGAPEFRRWTSQYGFEQPEPNTLNDKLKNALGLVRNIRSYTTDRQWSATFAVPGVPGARSRVTMLPQAGTEVMFAEIPSVRQAKESEAKVLDYWMPLLIARRTGESLTSEFLAVHEPYSDQPFLDSISGDAHMLTVHHGDTTDVHLFGRGNDEYQMEGVYGFIRKRENKIIHMLLVDGTHLRHKEQEITQPAAAEGRILTVDGRSLLASGRVNASAGDRIYLTFPLPDLDLPEEQQAQRRRQSGRVQTMRIETISADGDNTRIALTDDPRFTLNTTGTGGKYTAFPNSSFAGTIKFRIPRNGSFSAQAP